MPTIVVQLLPRNPLPLALVESVEVLAIVYLPVLHYQWLHSTNGVVNTIGIDTTLGAVDASHAALVVLYFG